MRQRLSLAVCGTLVAVVLAGCTEVPRTSDPQAIQSQPLQQPGPPPNPPQPGWDQRRIVQEFISANAGSDVNHNSARQYLTPSEKSRWSDDRVTVVSAQANVGVAHPDNTVVVNGVRIASIDATGAYTPVLSGDGVTGTPYTAKFTMKRINGEWRIDELPPGLLVTSAQVAQQFQQRAIYFYNVAEKHLVPDPRYTQLLDPDGLSNWLIRTLAAGPRDALSAAPPELPNQTDPRRVSIAVGPDASQPADIVIPGASQLNSATRTKLATEIAATLAQVAEIGDTRSLTILDGTEPVDIPNLGSTFTANDFAAQISPTRPTPQLYYIDPGGGVVNEQGVPLPGRIGDGYYDLTSVALAARPGSRNLLVAGTRLDKGVETFDVGREGQALEPVAKVTGHLSRPTWAPDLPEVWIAAGSKLYRVSEKGVAASVPVNTPTGPAVGQIHAIRFSPEGARVAMVLQTTDGQSVWVGAVVRDNGKVRVDGLTQVTANGIVMTDVAWNDELKLFGIGHDAATKVSGVYEVQCDGSRWSPRGTGILPFEPDSITVAGGQVAAVSAANTVWKQQAGTWESPQGDETDGRAPIYGE